MHARAPRPSVTLLYEVRLVDGAGGGLATTRGRDRDADSNQIVEIEQALAHEGLAPSFGEPAPHLQLDAVVAAHAACESY